MSSREVIEYKHVECAVQTKGISLPFSGNWLSSEYQSGAFILHNAQKSGRLAHGFYSGITSDEYQKRGAAIISGGVLEFERGGGVNAYNWLPYSDTFVQISGNIPNPSNLHKAVLLTNSTGCHHFASTGTAHESASCSDCGASLFSGHMLSGPIVQNFYSGGFYMGA